jgi:beta-glucosidase/6-phospho-beta-glucosidase/beta-galactosidase
MRPATSLSYAHLGAFESTKIHGSGEDILSTTRHLERWRHDLGLLHGAGIRDLRYSVPWHRIEISPGEWDWRWMDQPMRFFERNGMRPILDPLHHTSFPDWLTGGFANPNFPALYQRFVEAVARRYDWVAQYTVFNEPLPTTLFCSYTGMWYPHGCSEREFASMAVNVGKAICMAGAALKKMNPRVELVHIDTCEHHQAADRRSEAWAEFANLRRFLLHDLALGRLDRDHPLRPYLLTHGVTRDELAWFEDHPAVFDVLGLDYYLHSEMEWAWSGTLKRADIRLPCERPRGFASVAHDYVKRYRLPILLGETNLRGTVTDRLTWLKFMEEQCERVVQDGVDFRGFCWYPSIDSTDWCHCCTKCTFSVDPQGIWRLDRQRRKRHPSILSEYYALLASGQARSKDIPAYRFHNGLEEQLRGYRGLMSHWDRWQDPGELEFVA